MSNAIERSFSVKNRNAIIEESSKSTKIPRHFPNQVYKQDVPLQLKDGDKVNELMKLAEQIKVELFKVKLCFGCKRKFSCIASLMCHEEHCEGQKKVKI